MNIDKWLETEEDALEKDLNEERISPQEYNLAMRKLLREARAAVAEEER